MKDSANKQAKNKRKGSDRRQTLRYDTSILIHIRFMPDGTPLNGSAVEIGPNGMRILSSIPLVEGSYIHISFQSASNQTHCEGRVVWTQSAEGEGETYESGIDIQRWGGGIPGEDPAPKISNLKPKKDRRDRK